MLVKMKNLETVNLNLNSEVLGLISFFIFLD